MSIIERLNELRNHGGKALTRGLSDETLLRFAALDKRLEEAVEAAHESFLRLREEEPEILAMDEEGQIQAIQEGYVNFYPDDAINPYVSLAGNGPWVVSMKGAVLYDTGGYGMLGFGHSPQQVLDAMNQRHVMANVMTPNLSQTYLVDRLRREIGHTRGSCPFERFVCMNSGSEAVAVGARLADINTKLMTDPGGRHEIGRAHV